MILIQTFLKKGIMHFVVFFIYISSTVNCRQRLQLEIKIVNINTNENMRNRTFFIFPIVVQRKETQHAAPTKNNNIDVFN